MARSRARPKASFTRRARLSTWIAAHLHDVASPRFPEFSREKLGKEMTYHQAWAAAEELQGRSEWRDRPGPKVKDGVDVDPDQAQAAALVPWLLVDEPTLGLLRILYRLPNDGLPRPEVLRAVAELVGIRQVLELSTDREILLVAVVRDLEDARDLRSRIEDHAEGHPVEMHVIDHETHLPARRTWIELASQEFEPAREDE